MLSYVNDHSFQMQTTTTFDAKRLKANICSLIFFNDIRSNSKFSLILRLYILRNTRENILIVFCIK